MSINTSASARSNRGVGPRTGRHIEPACRREDHAAASTVASFIHPDALRPTRAGANADDELRCQAFVAAAAHDLKTPLTSLTLWLDTLQVLKPRLGAGNDTQAVALLNQALEQMHTLVERSLHLVDQVLDVTRLEAGRPLPFAPGEVELVALARQVLQGRPQDRERLLRLDAAQSELWGWWDAGRLARLVENLLANAIKYSPRRQPITLRVALDHNGGQPWAVLEVEDHGIGIPSVELPHMFEPFHRAPNAPPTTSGNGLGLWGCRTIVEQHGGTVTIASREGEGTTVTVRLPVGSSPNGRNGALTASERIR
jgi:signal transduction histidine kinase